MPISEYHYLKNRYVIVREEISARSANDEAQPVAQGKTERNRWGRTKEDMHAVTPLPMATPPEEHLHTSREVDDGRADAVHRHGERALSPRLIGCQHERNIGKLRVSVHLDLRAARVVWYLLFRIAQHSRACVPVEAIPNGAARDASWQPRRSQGSTR